MNGRLIPDEHLLLSLGYRRADFVRRRSVLRETLEAITSAEPPGKYRLFAAANLCRWKDEAQPNESVGKIWVINGYPIMKYFRSMKCVLLQRIFVAD